MSDEGWVPNRPHIPFSLYLLCAGFAMCQVALYAGVAIPPGVRVPMAATALLVPCVIAMGRDGTGVTLRACAVASVCALCACAASGLVETMDATASVLGRTAVSSCELRVESDPSLGKRGYRARAAVWRAGRRLGDVWVTSERRFGTGWRLRAVGRFSRGKGEWRAFARRQGVCGTVNVVHVIEARPPTGLRAAIDRLRSHVLDEMGPKSSPARAILAGSVCGDKDALRELGLEDVFAICGVAHLVAVSGGHIAIASAIVGRLLGRGTLAPVWRVTILMVATGAFVVFCGAPVSAVRSWLMCGVAFGSRLAGRRAHSLSGVCAVALGMVALDPGVTGQLGFTLSVVSVVGLCILSPYMGYVLRVAFPTPRLPRRVPPRVRSRVESAYGSSRDVVAACLVAQLVTGPITCSTFGTLSLVAPLANLLLAPLFTLLVGAGMAYACLGGTQPVATPFLLACDVAGGLVARLLGWMAGLPLASVAVSLDLAPACAITAALVAALLVAWPRLRRGPMLAVLGTAALLAACLLLRWRAFSPARVCVLDVGQGDAILVQDGAAAVLVDTGPDDSCAKELGRLHVTHLDAVLITHLHDDHYGGLSSLRGNVACDRVIFAEGVSRGMPVEVRKAVRDLAGGRTSEVGLGDTVRVGRFRLRVVWPEGPVDGMENEDSVELALEFDDGGRRMSGLLTGDAEEDQTGEAIRRGRVGDVDFLKVGHHGSRVSIDAVEAGRLDPEVSVASAGRGNKYGHPSPECVKVLRGCGSRFLCTMDVGTVTLEPGEKGVRVSVERGGDSVLPFVA
ncbi:MAG: ComEC/Rec2 family competence protein [Parafannyhessea sp.]|uniref:ComEC/Rec2 family competence protein n=1 Tax=Parafannyhessea sp. TaxID=2847324 RepID=UPI003F1086EC